VFSKKADEVREMASLTKIMTCLVSLHLANEMKLDINKTWFKVSKRAADTIGTSANLTENQKVTIFDLLYGLMLPSGNDAAVTLAENFTERLLKIRGKRKEV
jgi:D-alanyl-D-alanine carboxypeptidase